MGHYLQAVKWLVEVQHITTCSLIRRRGTKQLETYIHNGQIR